MSRGKKSEKSASTGNVFRNEFFVSQRSDRYIHINPIELLPYISIDHLNKHLHDIREIHRQSDKENSIDHDVDNNNRIIIDLQNRAIFISLSLKHAELRQFDIEIESA